MLDFYIVTSVLVIAVIIRFDLKIILPRSDSFFEGVTNFQLHVFDLRITMVRDFHFTQKLKAPGKKNEKLRSIESSV